MSTPPERWIVRRSDEHGFKIDSCPMPRYLAEEFLETERERFASRKFKDCIVTLELVQASQVEAERECRRTMNRG